MNYDAYHARQRVARLAAKNMVSGLSDPQQRAFRGSVRNLAAITGISRREILEQAKLDAYRIIDCDG